jgi:hypothetical protein
MACCHCHGADAPDNLDVWAAVVAEEAVKLGLGEVIEYNVKKYATESAVLDAMQWAREKMTKPGYRQADLEDMMYYQ